MASIIYANGRFVAASESGDLVTSTDGITWTVVSSSLPLNEWKGIAYGNGKFVAVSGNSWSGGLTDWMLSIPCTGNCGNPTEPAGSIIYNADFRVLQWCDGSLWQSAGPVGPSGPNDGCDSPSETGGSIIFNGSYCVMQYCDGDAWRPLGSMDPDACD